MKMSFFKTVYSRFFLKAVNKKDAVTVKQEYNHIYDVFSEK